MKQQNIPKLNRKNICCVLAVVLFCLFLCLMFIAYLLQPGKSYSEKEKRYLAQEPSFDAAAILSGSFASQCESWAADHIPGRDFFVELSAQADRLMGLQPTKEIYLGRSGRLYERPYRDEPDLVQRNMNALNAFAASVDVPVDMLLVPSAGFFMSRDIAGLSDPYIDDSLISSAYALAGENVHPLDILSAFQATESPEKLYYKTDHHWTSLGAYTAYKRYMDFLALPCLSVEDYSVSTEDGFYGTTYARSCFWEIPAESLELWDSGGAFTVTFSDVQGEFDGLFFKSRLSEADKYPVYLDGNHPLVTVTNPNSATDEKLLVIRDSYANCLGGFLADSFQQVTLADLRYYKLPISQLCRDGDFDRVLFVYYIGNFMTDSNIVWLS